jgi:hypothetical protein
MLQLWTPPLSSVSSRVGLRQKVASEEKPKVLLATGMSERRFTSPCACPIAFYCRPTSHPA